MRPRLLFFICVAIVTGGLIALLPHAHLQATGDAAAASMAPVASVPGASPQAIYTSPNAEPQGQFASHMAAVGDINGDGSTDVVAGAVGERVEEASDAGRAYVLSGADGTVLHAITPPTPRPKALFGYSVAGVGDTNSDDVPDLVIGAAGDSTLVGRAYLVDGMTGEIRGTMHSPHPDSTDRGLFGRYPAGVGDVTGDGADDFVVGAIGEDRAYLYSGAPGSLVRTMRSSSPVHDHFGVVAKVGDTNDDGVPDFFVGAPTDSLGRPQVPNAGQGHILSGATGQSLLTIASPTPTANGFFGAAVADVNARADTVPGNLLVGAYGANRAYLIRGSDGTVRHELPPTKIRTGGEFGKSVAGAGDVNGDSVPDLLVGAPADSVEGVAGAGRVHLFSGAEGTLLRSWSSPTPTKNGHFGRSLTVVRSTETSAPVALLVGAQDGSENKGRIYRFRL